MPLRALIVAMIAMLVLGTGQASAEKRVALVIGNSAYVNVPELANPRNDALRMSKRLADFGFEVVQGLDLDLQAMRAKVREFVRKLDGTDIALFYYAGHGLQVNDKNFIAPVDATLNSEDDLNFETMPFSFVLAAMERKARTSMVFLDACRDNPLTRNLARSMGGTRSATIGRGLARMGSAVGTFISYSTEPGNIALDGSGENSPYTSALLKHLGEPGESLSQSMVKVRRDVIKATSGKQVPWEHSSLTGEVILQPAPETQPQAVSPATPAKTTTVTTVPLRNEHEFELTFWNSIKDSNDPELYQAYLAKYPEGTFSAIARFRIKASGGTGNGTQTSTAEATQTTEDPKPETSATQEETTYETAAVTPEEGPATTVQEQATGEAPVPDPVSRETVRSIQRQLNRLGCNLGRADGLWGAKSRAALALYNRHANSSIGAIEPTAALLDELKSRDTRICPLVCRSGFKLERGRCQPIARQATVRPRVEPRVQRQQPPIQTAPRREISGGQGARTCYICKRRVGNIRRRMCMTRAEILHERAEWACVPIR